MDRSLHPSSLRYPLTAGRAAGILRAQMKRRFFLAAPTLLPALAHAQQSPPLIGVLRVGGRAGEQFEPVFRRDLRRLGQEDGKTYRLQVLFADGDSSRLPALAAELVTMGAKVLVTF